MALPILNEELEAMTTGAPIRVLVVEADINAHPLYRLFFGHWQLDIVRRWSEAEELLAEVTPDIAVIDPEEAGADVPTMISRLRDHTRFCVVHTLHSPEPHEQLTVHRWLLKPSWNDLVRHVQIHLSERSGGRREARRPARLPAFAWSEGEDDMLRVSTIDVSRAGCALETNQPIEAGTKLRLAVAGGRRGRVRVTGSVRYARPMPNAKNRWRIGLQLDVPPQSTDWYKPLVDQPTTAGGTGASTVS